MVYKFLNSKTILNKGEREKVMERDSKLGKELIG